MTTYRSKSKQRIIDAAFEHFVRNGYEGASLNTIAEAVGIRKASIYTHFKSKDALFLELLEDALTIECAYLETCFKDHSTYELPGEAYLYAIKSRYENAITSQFLTRIAYVPPTHLIDHVIEAYRKYMEKVMRLFKAELSQALISPQDQELYTDAYLGILDSLSVELLYDGTMYERRLYAMLMLYRNSMKK
ncbi:TetR/AcrR family transcriptional regulator [Acinetobacter sichuanensis]|uniref:TetR/AcrR family transcriptional regulator n=1 Tax=Acinetobacter sichuanensis TaxID=2136183 RepID=UPI00281060EC|nr:TetR/AcrR family transcriptional regulator [Acinetobacter sichuanensis]MDQ9021248.1 TetR/AcrR family transcriptional regulator [Acinetobacter sichuanensis]